MSQFVKDVILSARTVRWTKIASIVFDWINKVIIARKCSLLSIFSSMFRTLCRLGSTYLRACWLSLHPNPYRFHKEWHVPRHSRSQFKLHAAPWGLQLQSTANTFLISVRDSCQCVLTLFCDSLTFTSSNAAIMESSASLGAIRSFTNCIWCKTVDTLLHLLRCLMRCVTKKDDDKEGKRVQNSIVVFRRGDGSSMCLSVCVYWCWCCVVACMLVHFCFRRHLILSFPSYF